MYSKVYVQLKLESLFFKRFDISKSFSAMVIHLKNYLNIVVRTIWHCSIPITFIKVAKSNILTKNCLEIKRISIKYKNIIAFIIKQLKYYSTKTINKNNKQNNYNILCLPTSLLFWWSINKKKSFFNLKLKTNFTKNLFFKKKEKFTNNFYLIIISLKSFS